MKKYLFLFVLLGVFVSCNKDDDTTPAQGQNQGTIIATVKFNNGNVGPNINVITFPFTQELKTDAFGQVEFENIKSGKYDVYAYVDSYASGKTTLLVENNLQRIDIDLIADVLIEPYVQFYSPSNFQGYSIGEEIEFLVYVSDQNTVEENLKVEWESNVDGKLGEGSVNAENIASFRTDELSASEHYIKIKITNDLGVSSADSVFINTLSPRSLELSLEQYENFDVLLSWKTKRNDIDKFEVYRQSYGYGGPELLATLDANETQYLDTKVPFVDSALYFVKAYNIQAYSSRSNVVSSKGSPVFEIKYHQAEFSNSNSLVYIRSNNKIYCLDYEEMTILNNEEYEGNIGYFHVEDNGFGEELYVPNSDGWLYIYDLPTFEIKENINVGAPVECIISDGSGLLYTSVSPSPWWEDPLRVYNRSSLSFVDGGGDFDDCRLRLLPSKNEVIEISTSISPVDMDYYKFDENGNIIEHENDPYHGDYPLNANIFKIAPAQNYLVTSSSGAVYNADASLTYIGKLAKGNDLFSDFEFNASAGVIYAGMLNKKEINVYSYPSLSESYEIKTKGYPVSIYRKGNQLIVLSSPIEFDTYYGPQKLGVEVIQIND